MTSALAIRPANAVWEAAKDAVVVENARTASKIADKSLEVTGMCSDGYCDVENGPAISGGAAAVGGGTGGDASGTDTGCSPLGRSSA